METIIIRHKNYPNTPLNLLPTTVLKEFYKDFMEMWNKRDFPTGINNPIRNFCHDTGNMNYVAHLVRRELYFREYGL